jgi:hypothetical protein
MFVDQNWISKTGCQGRALRMLGQTWMTQRGRREVGQVNTGWPSADVTICVSLELGGRCFYLEGELSIHRQEAEWTP